MHIPETTSLSDAVALAREAGDLLRARGWMLASAESCTGGLIGHVVTENPGSSDYFAGAAVTYSNAAKQAVLGVPSGTLAAHGAVSSQTAAAMAQGALRLFGAQVAVSVTGIAGPGGGTPDKPSGTVYIHLAAADGTQRGEHFVWESDRSGNKLLSALAALLLVLDYLRASS